MAVTSFVPRGDFIDGRWVRRADGVLARVSPANLDDFIGEFPLGAMHVDEAVAAARNAQPAWEALPLTERMAFLRAFKSELGKREDAIVALLGREVGKPAWEARTEARAIRAKVDVTLDEGLRLVRDFELDDGRHRCRYRPHGVLAVIGPFNFPLHLPNGHIVPALATGNTVVFKPSEHAPALAQVYLEAAEAAGLPKGVLNLVQGAGDAGARLAEHDGTDGVLFTGSYAVGTRILEANATRPGRLLALELGGKNAAVVLRDAPYEKAVHDVLYSAAVTCGQRCTAVSRLIVERPVAEPFADALVQCAKRLHIGPPTDPHVFMGPLISENAFERFREAQRRADAETRVLLASTDAVPGPRGYYVTPGVHRVERFDATSPYQTQELFGPDIALYVAEDRDHALELANATDYGLAASVFTQSRVEFEHFAQRLAVGVLAWNAPSVGSSSRLPFGGLRRSGNQRPAGLFSTLYCTYPLAITEGATALDTSALAPGMGWI